MRSTSIALVFLLATLPVPWIDADSGSAPAGRFHVSDDQLGALVEGLLEENPQVRSLSARSESVRARMDQVGSLPDPLLNYRFFAETPETRVGPQEHMLEISQGVPWRGKRRLQTKRAEHMASGLSWEAEDLERQLVASLKRRYYEAAYLQEALTVNREERELLKRFEAIALTRYTTGQGIQQSVVRVQTEISRLSDRATDLQKRLAIVTRGIAELIAHPERDLFLEPIVLTLPELEYDGAEIETRALAGHPRVHAVEQMLEADRVWADRRALESKPDFRFGLGYTMVGSRDDPAGVTNPPPDNGQDILAFSVGVSIPMQRKKVRAGVAEVRESERANGEMLNAVQDRLRFAIQEALLQLESLDERARFNLEVIIPQAGESLASAEAAYTSNQLDFLDLLEAERILFQSRLAYHRLVADFWIATADLERSAAHPFPALGERHE
jgi:outer membrane protein TolC